MSTSRLSRKSTAAIAVVAALAFSAVASASASAFEWVQGETSMRWATDEITLEKNGANPVDCQFGEIKSTPTQFMPGAAYGAKAEGWGGVNNGQGRFGWISALQCDGGKKLEIELHIQPDEEVAPGVFAVTFYNMFELTNISSPYGGYTQEWTAGTFTNGSGGEPSTLSLDDAVFGWEWGAPWNTLSLTGTFEVTQADGSLLTLES